MFKKKYREGSLRLSDWDYSAAAHYYLTVCVKDRVECLGNIENENMNLSELGGKVTEFWNSIPAHFNSVVLDSYVVMPNHIHGIIVIRDNNETCHGMSLRKGRFSAPQKGSVGTIIGQFKSSAKRWANKNEYENFQWQSGYYEHIIRDEKSLEKIRNYIKNNVLQWDLDEYNKSKG